MFPGRGDELASQLYEVLHEKVLKLPDACLVYPAHGAGSLCGKAMGAMRVSTIGYERRFNPALRHETEAEFKETLLSGMPEAPDYFARCSEINRRGPALVGEMPAPRALSTEELQAAVEEGHTVLDVRDYAAFGGAHVPGAYNIDARPQFLDVRRLASASRQTDCPDRRVGQRDCPDCNDAPARRPGRRGRLSGRRYGAVDRRRDAHRPRAHDDDFRGAAVLRGGTSATVFVDVRAAAEWDLTHIDGAVHIPLPATRTRHSELDRDAMTVLVCKSGARAGAGAGILQQHGFKNLAVMAGGMTAWTAAGFAPECATCALPHGPRIQ